MIVILKAALVATQVLSVKQGLPSPDRFLICPSRAWKSLNTAASSAFADTGVLDVGRWGDVTCVDVDLLRASDFDSVERARVTHTIVGGDVVFSVDDASEPALRRAH